MSSTQSIREEKQQERSSRDKDDVKQQAALNKQQSKQTDAPIDSSSRLGNVVAAVQSAVDSGIHMLPERLQGPALQLEQAAQGILEKAGEIAAPVVDTYQKDGIIAAAKTAGHIGKDAASEGIAAVKSSKQAKQASAKAADIKGQANAKSADLKAQSADVKDAAAAKSTDLKAQASDLKDAAAAKAIELKDAAASKATELQASASSKATELKGAAAAKTADLQAKGTELKGAASANAADAKALAGEKLGEAKAASADKSGEAKSKSANNKAKAKAKAAQLQQQAAGAASNIQAQAASTLSGLQAQAGSAKTAALNQAGNIKAAALNKAGDLQASAASTLGGLQATAASTLSGLQAQAGDVIGLVKEKVGLAEAKVEDFKKKHGRRRRGGRGHGNRKHKLRAVTVQQGESVLDSLGEKAAELKEVVVGQLPAKSATDSTDESGLIGGIRNRVASAATGLQSTASGLVGSAQSTASGIIGSAQSSASGIIGSAQSTASGIISTAQSKLSGIASSAKPAAIERKPTLERQNELPALGTPNTPGNLAADVESVTRTSEGKLAAKPADQASLLDKARFAVGGVVDATRDFVADKLDNASLSADDSQPMEKVGEDKSTLERATQQLHEMQQAIKQ